MNFSWLDRMRTVVPAWFKAFGLFWYRFIIGDDWTVAATVAIALLATWLLLRTASVSAWWLPPLAAVAAVGASLRRTSS
jgi:hypothetical protein